MKTYFKITSVSREDLESIGINADTLTDKDMQDIAQRMAEAYCQCCFWNDLESIAMDVYKLKQEEL